MIELSDYDSADYLHSDEDAVEYLVACLEEAGDDPAFLAQVLGTVVRARSLEAELTDADLLTLTESGNPTLTTVVSVLKALECRLSVAPL